MGWLVLIPSNVRLLAYSYVLIGCFSGKISHNILKNFLSSKGNLLFSPLFSLSKNGMHDIIWCYSEILPVQLATALFFYSYFAQQGKHYYLLSALFDLIPHFLDSFRVFIVKRIRFYFITCRKNSYSCNSSNLRPDTLETRGCFHEISYTRTNTNGGSHVGSVVYNVV